MKLFEVTFGNEIDKLIEEYDNKKSISSGSFDMTHDYDFNRISCEASGSVKEYEQFLQSIVLQNVVNVGATSFVGHMTASVPPLYRELNELVTALNQNQVKIETSLVATKIERQVVGTFHHLIYQHDQSFYDQYVQNREGALGVVTNGGTISNITALSYALNHQLGADEKFQGVTKEGLIAAMKHYGYEKAVVLGSSWCHYSIGKALKLFGLGTNAFVTLDFEGRNQAETFEYLTETIETLRKEKTLVVAMVGVAGSTESGSVDPLEVLGRAANQLGVHFHVDAAFGGVYLFDDELRNKLSGIEHADSVSICSHKQLYTPIGMSYCIFKDPEFVKSSENNTAYQARKQSPDLGKYTIEGTRNFMSLLLHGAINLLGKEGFAEIIRNNHQNAHSFANLIDSNEFFDLLFEPDLNIVLYRIRPKHLIGKKSLSDQELEEVNELNKTVQQLQFAKGDSFVSYTSVKQKENSIESIMLRAVLINPYTTSNQLKDMLEEQIQWSLSFTNEAISEKETEGLIEETLVTSAKADIISKI